MYSDLTRMPAEPRAEFRTPTSGAASGNSGLPLESQLRDIAPPPREPLLTVEELSRRLNVSTKTISRWRQQGLQGHDFVLAGHKRIGFRQSDVDRFIARHSDRVRRATHFSQLTEGQRQGIIAEGRRLIQEGTRPAEVIRHLARETGRSVETIRYTLKQFDRDNPREAVLSPREGVVCEQMRREIYQRYRRGESIDALARRFSCGKTTVGRIVAAARYRQLSNLPLDYIPNASFASMTAEEEAEVLGPRPPVKETPRRARRPSGLPPYLASLYEVPLLSREQEWHLFRKMNYLKHRASEAFKRIDPARPAATLMDQVESDFQQSVAVKNEIMRANLRLVVSIAKRYTNQSQTLFDLVSDGNMSLMRAVEKFDYGRGFKFSTYATWAIIKNFARSIPNEQRYRNRFRTSREETFTSTEDLRGDFRLEENAQNRREGQVARMMGHLDDREKQIVDYRYGLSHGREPMTLKEVGAAMGVTKERIRQLESRALAKLRRAARDERIEVAE